MNKNLAVEIFKYFDCFGTTFNFYIERDRKLYTSLGGILSILSFIFGILVFIFINLDDLLQKNPNSTTSIAKENYRKIKFKDEKIWIPWRLCDYGSQTINHTGLIYPIIYYYKGIKNNYTNNLDISYDIISYKLCNETSMINYINMSIIDVKLDQLFCIDMEDLDMGGSWDSDFINYITFDLYLCENGIDYDENNQNCSSYEKMINASNKYGYIDIEIFYPIIQYQPINKKNPIVTKYTNYFYHLSLFSNKIDRFYLQQHILIDDKGIINKDENLISYWGCESINLDYYVNGNKKDLMGEGSSSRIYSFNIYLIPEVIYYNRTYKGFFLIIIDGLPIIYIIFHFFKFIVKSFKISSGNKKLTELLFENLKEKKHYMKLRKNDIIYQDNKPNKIKNKNKNLKGSLIHKNINDISIINLLKQESIKKLINNINKKESNENKKVLKTFKNSKSQNIVFKNNLIKRLSITDSHNIDNNPKHNYIHKYSSKKNIVDFYSSKDNDKSNILLNKINEMKNNDYSKFSRKISSGELKDKSKYIRKSLFPYKYYLCSIFIHNFDESKQSFFFTQKFIAVYNFICQLFDISSYLILQREFQIMKNTLMVEEYKDILEKGHKINVNDKSFNIAMKECLDSRKFSILGKVK